MSRIVVALFLSSLCISCGGGGGGSSNPAPPNPPASEFTVTTSNLNFVADDFLASAAPQSVSGTINTSAAGTVYILVEVTGQAVQTVGGFSVSGTTGSALVYPADPNVLGIGTHNSTLRIRACVNSSTCANGELTGSPRTVNVSYTVNAPVPNRDAVFPRIAVSGQAGDVILRGTNFSGVSSVSFGGQPALSFTVISATEIRARHAALVAGNQAISLNGGATSFTAGVSAIDPQDFPASILNYPPPSPEPWTTPRPIFDASRKAIYVVLPVIPTGPFYAPGPSRLLRYTHDGAGWTDAQFVTITGLGNVILGPTQSSLLGFTDDTLLEIDPDSLAVIATYPLPADNWRFPASTFFVNHLALTNDGYVVVTFGCRCGSSNARIYFFNPVTHQFRLVQPNSTNDTTLSVDGAHAHRAFVSGDGARVMIGQFRYDPSTGGFGRQIFPHGLRDNNVSPLIEMDRAATRLVLTGTIDPSQYASPKYVEIYDGSYQLLGKINEAPYEAVQDLHAAISGDGSRLHVMHYDFLQEGIVALSTYDISAAPSPTFPMIGSRMSLPLMKRVSVDSGVTLTPDGRTLLIAGDNGLFVQPVP